MWTFGDILNTVTEAAAPSAPAFIHDGRITTWKEAGRRMQALAEGLISRGAMVGDKVAFYLRNNAAYGEMAGACFLASLTHINVNYRYSAAEVAYILDNADAAVIFYDSEFRCIVEELRPLLPKLRIFVEVGGAPDTPEYAADFEQLASTLVEGVELPQRSPRNQLMIYTGGTTGMPKAVVFHEGDLALFLFECSTIFGTTLPQTLADVAAMVRRRGEGGRRYLPACPQMHSTGFFVTIWTMLTGGCVITMSGRTLDAPGIWQTAARDRATNIAIVGDSFARPLLAALDAAPGRYSLENLEIIGSSGAMWSAEIKERLVRHLPHVQMLDVMSSTEAIGLAASVTTRESQAATGGFALGPNAILIDKDNRPMRPGSGVPGRVAVGGGMQPFCYYKDPEKTKKTFPVIDGVRYSVPGDYALLEADGTIRLLGRGSSCINTGGEKVFPEEVEEALKTHPSVQDALVIGVPDPAWGQAVTGVITLAPAASLDQAVLRAHVKARLAGYKVPKSIVIADVSLRGPNGKADYKAAAACAARSALF
jgi:acyl-CoA synthetase (AMP-forming)/AMP-acid ligase II